MNNDLISRQAAIDGKISIQRSDGVEIYDDYAVPVEYLKQLPPAQPEQCEDAVSRKAVQYLLAHFVDEDKYIDACDGLKHLPPVTPEQRTGKWVMNDRMGTFKIFTCDKCGWNSEAPFNFCPNCGAKMKGGAE